MSKSERPRRQRKQPELFKPEEFHSEPKKRRINDDGFPEYDPEDFEDQDEDGESDFEQADSRPQRNRRKTKFYEPEHGQSSTKKPPRRDRRSDIEPFSIYETGRRWGPKDRAQRYARRMARSQLHEDVDVALDIKSDPAEGVRYSVRNRKRPEKFRPGYDEKGDESDDDIDEESSGGADGQGDGKDGEFEDEQDPGYINDRYTLRRSTRATRQRSESRRGGESESYTRRSQRNRRQAKELYSEYLTENPREDRKRKASQEDGSHYGMATRSKRRRRAHAYNQDDDNDIEDESSSSSEAAFDNREARRLHRERAKIRPINMEMHELSALPLHGYKSQKSGGPADVDPANIDTSVDWKSIGGLENHVTALKEMVTLPLLYPELFQHFSITPPRGVIFYGPPGTGKTLVARALASTCSRHGQKVSFFMRKGADCLSKWVGEAERQLRLLFEQARRCEPSIIFFDEIDGLAPVRSSRQDQIHSSIVSTLLALMDGLDNRGQVIVIGATNRLDAIDPALRRPGRFDRELRFGLPNYEAREKILAIHTRKWNPVPTEIYRQALAKKTTGYSGADLRALCTEASLEALRRLFPEVYTSVTKVSIDKNRICVRECDFDRALAKIIPTSKRSRNSPANILPFHMKALLGMALDDITKHFSSNENSKAISKKSKFLIHGDGDMGQAHLGPAILHELESLPSFSIDLPTLLSDSSSRSAEESLTRQVMECCSHAPSILYWPHIDLWWHTASESLKTCILMLLDDIPESSKVAIVAVSDCNLEILPSDLKSAFDQKTTKLHLLTPPSMGQRHSFFRQLIAEAQIPPEFKAKPVCAAARELVSVDTESSKNTGNGDEKKSLPKDQECNALDQEDELTLCKLRMFLRSVVERLMRYFKDFTYPIDDPDYRRIIQMPISLVDIRDKINNGVYKTVSQFLTDIDLLVSNAKEYYLPDKFVGRNIINKACHLQDSTFSMMCQFPRGLAVKCNEIQARRELVKTKNRSNDPEKSNNFEDQAQEGKIPLTENDPMATENQPAESAESAEFAESAESAESAKSAESDPVTLESSVADANENADAPNQTSEADSKTTAAAAHSENTMGSSVETDVPRKPVDEKSESKDISQETFTLSLDVQEIERVCELASKRTVDSHMKELEHLYLTMLMEVRRLSNSWDRSELPQILERTLLG